MTALLIACPYCFGAADSTQVQAAKIGVLVLLGFIIPLLGVIGFTAVRWSRRARALRKADEAPPLPLSASPQPRAS